MNLETKVADPELKFATGILKGRPLDTAGLDYKIITVRGEPVAQFTNGTMARFVREPEPLVALWAEPVETRINGVLVGLRDSCEPSDDPCHVGIDTGTGPVSLAPLNKQIIIPAKPARHTIGKLRRVTAGDPYYAELENHKAVLTFTRLEVGTGLREYLWVYQKLRTLGRGRLAAAWEAWEIYSL